MKPSAKRQLVDWWREERIARQRGYYRIAGVDEAGRGPLAGPVVAAAVVLPWEMELPEVRDSKTLSAAQRERAFDRVCAAALAVGVGVSSVEEVDRLNILRASQQAMRDAVSRLDPLPDLALIDGLPVHPFPVAQQAVVQGDGLSLSIAAASIIAKVTRDRLMDALHDEYPQYGFASHRGYATAEHLKRLSEHGPCPIHRRTFAPVAGAQSALDLGLEPPRSHRQAMGECGELAAATHLRTLGWQVLATNYRCRGGEVDIVALDGDTVVFVEVKARGDFAATPSEAVDARKRRRLAAAAEAFLAQLPLMDTDCRFDVAEVSVARSGHATVRLIRAAFMADE